MLKLKLKTNSVQCVYLTFKLPLVECILLIWKSAGPSENIQGKELICFNTGIFGAYTGIFGAYTGIFGTYTGIFGAYTGIFQILFGANEKASLDPKRMQN